MKKQRNLKPPMSKTKKLFLICLIALILVCMTVGFIADAAASGVSPDYLDERAKEYDLLDKLYENRHGRYYEGAKKYSVEEAAEGEPKNIYSYFLTFSEVEKLGYYKEEGYELEIDLFSTGMKDTTIEKAISSEKWEYPIYVNDALYTLGIPFSYYDSVDKYTYHPEYGYSVYFSDALENTASLDWDRITLAEDGSPRVATIDEEGDAYFTYGVYLGNEETGYAPINRRAAQTERIKLNGIFSLGNAIRIALTVLNVLFFAAMLAIAFARKYTAADKFHITICAAVCIISSIIQFSHASDSAAFALPFNTGLSLISIFSVASLIKLPSGSGGIRHACLCSAVCLCELVLYTLAYLQSNVALPIRYFLGVAVCATALMGVLAFREKNDTLPRRIISIVALSTVCLLAFYISQILILAALFIPIGAATFIESVNLGIKAVFDFVVGIILLCALSGGGYMILILIKK